MVGKFGEQVMGVHHELDGFSCRKCQSKMDDDGGKPHEETEPPRTREMLPTVDFFGPPVGGTPSIPQRCFLGEHGKGSLPTN